MLLPRALYQFQLVVPSSHEYYAVIIIAVYATVLAMTCKIYSNKIKTSSLTFLTDILTAAMQEYRPWN